MSKKTADVEQMLRIADLLQPSISGYGLELFTKEELSALELLERDGRQYVRCVVTNRERAAKPEEIVRQLFLIRLTRQYGYPKERIRLEKSVQFGSTIAEKRADIVIVDADDSEADYIIVEVKKPRRRDGFACASL